MEEKGLKEINTDSKREDSLNENKEVKRSLLQRITAIIMIMVILFCVGWIIWAIAVGSEHLIQIVFIALILPIIIYLFVWIKKVFSKNR